MYPNNSYYQFSTMGNILGGIRRKKAKVMKITGESFKIRTPAVAAEALKGHPDHVLLNADAVKHFGFRARPLHPGQLLRPKKLYFLVHLPNLSDHDTMAPLPHRRSRSGIDMSANNRLDFFTHRRSVSDLPVIGRRPEEAGSSGGGGPVRVKVRLPRAQVEKLMEECRDDVEVAEKIIDLYISTDADQPPPGNLMHRPEAQWKPGLESITEIVR